jgi:hypothetical protein
MKDKEHPAWSVAIYGVAFAGVFLTLAGLGWIMRHYTQPPPPDTEYWEQRSRNLSELNAQNQDWLQNYAWIDANRGIVRLPIARAMELTVQEWQHPELARSNLLFRVEQMAATPAASLPTNVPPQTNTSAAAKKP